jgi:protein phosphatase PTC2/3
MEDAHAVDLFLNEGDNSNAFFAVYDGHGGMFAIYFGHCGVFFSSSRFVGDTVSKFSGINVHKRLVTEKAYHEKRYEDALKSAFIGTDEDFLCLSVYRIFCTY